MKRIYTLFSIVLFATMGLQAQEANECSVNLSLEHDYIKSQRYEEAYSYWEKVHNNCPKESEAIYNDGIKIYKNRLKLAKKEKNEAKKAEAFNMIVKLYDEWANYFPSSKYIGKVYQDKGLLLMRNKKATKSELYKIFSKGYELGANGFTNPQAIYAYFNAGVNEYKNNNITFEELIQLYDKLSGAIESVIEKKTVQMESLQKRQDAGELMKKEERQLKAIKYNMPKYGEIAGEMDKILGELGDCTHLIPLYKKNYEANKENSGWLKKAARNLSKKECTNDPIFKKMVVQLDNIQPSYSSSLYLGILYKSEGNKAKAKEYFLKAIGLTEKAYDKAKIYYLLASMAKKSGQKVQARTYARKALANRPSMGSAYLLIANLYAKSADACGKKRFTKLATYWLAAQMADKAAAVDPSRAASARRSAKRWRQLAPSKEEVFMKQMAGKTIHFKCWINSSVVVPGN